MQGTAPVELWAWEAVRFGGSAGREASDGSAVVLAAPFHALALPRAGPQNRAGARAPLL